MNRKLLTVSWGMEIVIVLFLAGCAVTSPKDKSSNNDSKNVRVSGDVTVSTVDRKGF